jgi:hypothetical protein
MTRVPAEPFYITAAADAKPIDLTRPLRLNGGRKTKAPLLRGF